MQQMVPDQESNPRKCGVHPLHMVHMLHQLTRQCCQKVLYEKKRERFIILTKYNHSKSLKNTEQKAVKLIRSEYAQVLFMHTKHEYAF